MDILDVQRKVRLDNSITEMEFHNHVPNQNWLLKGSYALPVMKVGEVRNVGITSTMKGYFSESKNSVTASLIHNAGAFMFSHIRYIISGVEVGEVRNVGITSTMKGYFSYSPSYVNKLENCGWDEQVVMNVLQELVLKRCADDSDVIFNSVTTEDLELTINNTTKHSWAIKTAPHLETPGYIILGFQTGRKGHIDKNMSKFDSISLTDVTAYLNVKRFPYENIEADFNESRIAVLYDMYTRIQTVYYGYEYTEPLLKLSQFKLCPLIGIDWSYQEVAIHRTGVEVRIEFTTKESVPKDTTVYCLILHNKMYEYSPFNKVVRRKY
ncbi:hypothetical protein QE152_g22057 [Popillia japonica]|uniref:Double jelly roll-like domain-containing protein n=1 Tax=Popillia japonica TaxID=7064 RepID=A0AAW1KMB5_POPJA